MTTLTLLRHGRTVANAGGLLQGRVDNELDDVGVAQAAAAAARIGEVDLVISSPLRRAVQTAAALSCATAVEVDDAWIELDYGDWDGKPLRDVPPETWRRWRADLDLRPPGGETLNELGTRVRTALEALTAGDLPNHVVVVSHVSPIKAAIGWALGVDDHIGWRLRLATAAWSSISLGGPTPSLVSFNHTSAIS